MIRQIIVALVLSSVFTGWLHAQQGGEQQTPPTPQPAPAPREPRPTVLAPEPTPGGMRQVNISGRLIADTSRQPDRTIEVKLEGQSSEAAGYAYTDGTGEFTFRGVSIRPDQNYYIVINAEGFKPVRERLDYRIDLTYGGRVTIFLESDTPLFKAVEGNGSNVVGLKQLQAKIPAKAIDEYKKALQESTAGKHSKAVERLEKATKLAPDFYEAQNNLGAQYLRLQRFTEAEAAFERARELNPGAAEPLLNLGSLYYQQGEMQSDSGKTDDAAGAFDKAVDFLDEAIRRNPASAPAHHYLGAALYKTASYEQAESSLHRALELDSKLNDVQLILVNVYTRQNRMAEALDQLKTYLEKNPKSPQRASLERMREQIDKVLKAQ